MEVISSQVRNLGSIISSDLSVDEQIAALSKSVVYHLRLIARVRKYLTRDMTHQAVRALVLSRLDFHNGLLIGAPAYQLQRLQRLQNWAARLIVRAPLYSHAMPIMRELHWLPICARVRFKVCVMSYRAIHGTAPSYLCSLITRYTPTRPLRSSTREILLVEPPHRTSTYGLRCFEIAGPRLWNRLPDALRGASSEQLFRKMLKTHLFTINFCTE